MLGYTVLKCWEDFGTPMMPMKLKGTSMTQDRLIEVPIEHIPEELVWKPLECISWPPCLSGNRRGAWSHASVCVSVRVARRVARRGYNVCLRGLLVAAVLRLRQVDDVWDNDCHL